MLNFTATEKRALLITLIIVVIAAMIQFVVPHHNNTQLFDYSQSDSIFYRLSQEKVNYKTTYSNHSKYERKKAKTGPELLSIDLNRASKSDLQKLPRIGPKTAERIIVYRKSVKKFSTNEELMKIKGIGPKTFAKLKPYLKEM